MNKKQFLILEAIAFALSVVGLSKDIAIVGAAGMAVFIVLPFYYLFTSLTKKKQEHITEANKPKKYTKKLWIHGTDEAETFFKAYKEDLWENEDYHLPAKDLHEMYEDEKVFKYDPYDLPFKIEGQKVYSWIDKDEWIYIGSIKRQDTDDLERSLSTTLYLYPNIFKYVTEGSIEKDEDEHYFGLEVTLPIGEKTAN